jgi:hypothetical protein
MLLIPPTGQLRQPTRRPSRVRSRARQRSLTPRSQQSSKESRHANEQDLQDRSLIAEPLSLRLSIDQTSEQAIASGETNAASRAVVAAGKPVAPPKPDATFLAPEAKRIADALQAICAVPPDTVVMWGGRQHKFIPQNFANAGKGTQLIGRPGSERAAQIVIAPVDQPEQHIFTKFAVVPNGKWAPGKPRFFLECEGNPTTLLTGNNILPVTTWNPLTEAFEPHPSSAPRVMITLNRVLFRYLEDIAAQITGNDAGLFEQQTRRAIKGGDFVIVHNQWCCYFRADVSRFLQVLSAIFHPRAATETGGFTTLAKQMGLIFDDVLDERNNRARAVLLEKRHGKNSAWSAVFYNKHTRVASMRQGKTLQPDERDLIANNVRFDMTAHTVGIMRLIEKAMDYLRLHLDQFVRPLGQERLDALISGTPEPTARWLEAAVFILSHRLYQGQMRRGSFEDYLVPFFLNDVLQLPSIVCCTPEGLRSVEELPHDVAKAWREDKSHEAKGWADRLAKAANCSVQSVYERRDEWQKTYGINIEIPHASYRDLDLQAAITLMEDEERRAYHNARKQGDDRVRSQVLDQAGENLFSQMREFVGVPISTPPTLLRAKVIGEVKAVQAKGKKAKPAPYLPEGISGRSTFHALGKAAEGLRMQMREFERSEGEPGDEWWSAAEQLERVGDLIVDRMALVKRTKRTRLENKQAARLKRMGGPMSHLKIKPPGPLTPPKK